jgi:hypothetical protein
VEDIRHIDDPKLKSQKETQEELSDRPGEPPLNAEESQASVHSHLRYPRS